MEDEGATLTILLSEILEILAMSRLSAILTGSPKNEAKHRKNLQRNTKHATAAQCFKN